MIIPQQIDSESQSAHKSTGPKTQEGKQRSRLNATKHGLSGEAMTFARLNEAAFIERFKEWRSLYVIRNAQDEWFYGELIAESLRVDHCRALISLMTGELIDRAVGSWENDRRDEIGKLAAGLNKNPVVVARELRTTKYGCEYLVEAWEGLLRILRKIGDWDDAQKTLALDLLGVLPCLRAGHDLFELGVEDEARKLRADRETYVLTQIASLREMIQKIYDELDVTQRAKVKKGCISVVPKPLATLLRYEKESSSRFNNHLRRLKPCRVPDPSASSKPARPRTPSDVGLKKRDKPISMEELVPMLPPELQELHNSTEAWLYSSPIEPSPEDIEEFDDSVDIDDSPAPDDDMEAERDRGIHEEFDRIVQVFEQCRASARARAEAEAKARSEG